MPKLVHKIPVPRLHKPSGQMRLRIGGREFYLGAPDDPETQRKAGEVVGRWLANGKTWAEDEPAAKAKGPALSVVEALHRYADHLEERFGASRTLDNHQEALRPLRKLCGKMPLAEVGPKAVKQVRDSMLKSGLARQTVLNRLVKVRQFFRWAVSEELIEPEVLQRIQALPAPAPHEGKVTDPRRPVSRELVEATLPHLDPMHRDMVVLLWLTGCRPSELAALTVSMIDRKDPELWVANLGRHKTAWKGKGRRILFGPRAISILKGHMGSPPEAPVFPGRSGAHMFRNTLQQAVRRACVRHKLPIWTIYQIRHATGTRFREEFGVEAAAQQLGHADPKVTLTIYTREADAAAREATKRSG